MFLCCHYTYIPIQYQRPSNIDFASPWPTTQYGYPGRPYGRTNSVKYYSKTDLFMFII